MTTPFPGPWDIYQPPELDAQLAAMRGKRAGLSARLKLLATDPCHSDVNGYRLSGPLEPKVCGAHLDRGYRLAYTIQQPLSEHDKPRVVVLYVGKREPGHRASTIDIWDTLHDLFNVENPPSAHEKPPCCQAGLPDIDPDILAEFLKRLRGLNRGR